MTAKHPSRHSSAVVTALGNGVGGPLGSGRQYVPWIHEEDQIAAIRFLIERQKPKPGWAAR